MLPSVGLLHSSSCLSVHFPRGPLMTADTGTETDLHTHRQRSARSNLPASFSLSPAFFVLPVRSLPARSTNDSRHRRTHTDRQTDRQRSDQAHLTCFLQSCLLHSSSCLSVHYRRGPPTTADTDGHTQTDRQTDRGLTRPTLPASFSLVSCILCPACPFTTGEVH